LLHSRLHGSIQNETDAVAINRESKHCAHSTIYESGTEDLMKASVSNGHFDFPFPSFSQKIKISCLDHTISYLDHKIS